MSQPTVVRPSVHLMVAATDADVADYLSNGLRDAGFVVVDNDGRADLDPNADVIVLMSAASLSNWSEVDFDTLAARLIPVRLGVLPRHLVPARLRELNWVDWDGINPARSLGNLLAGLYIDPLRRNLTRQIEAAADAWIRDGWSPALLVNDVKRVRQMVEVQHDATAGSSTRLSDNAIRFITASSQLAARRRRGRRRWWSSAAVAAVAAVVAVAVYVPAIARSHLNNRLANLTVGDTALAAELPEWLSVSAASLLINGTEAQKALARSTLLQTLNEPWRISAVTYATDLLDVRLLSGGRQALIVYAHGPTSALSMVDVNTAGLLWTIRLPGVFPDVSVSPDNRTALAVGTHGAAVIDLSTHVARPLATGTSFFDADVVDGTTSVVRLTASLAVATLDLNTGRLADVHGSYEATLDVAAATPVGPRVLAAVTGGTVKLIDVRTGRAVASAATKTSKAFAGGISPDGRQAIYAGTDGQLWTFGPGRATVPTGITAPAGVTGVLWTSNDRIVVYSDERRAQVYYLPKAEFLGLVCRDVPRVFQVHEDVDSGAVSCLGLGIGSFWRLPASPVGRQPGETKSLRASQSGTTITAQDNSVRIVFGGVRETAWFQPLSGSRITAVMLSADGLRALVGGIDGHVAFLGLAGQRSDEVATFTAPDAAAVAEIGWSNRPVATTASGQTWILQGCADCDTDPGLISTVRNRLTGCFTELQLNDIDAATRRTLGLHICHGLIGP